MPKTRDLASPDRAGDYVESLKLKPGDKVALLTRSSDGHSDCPPKQESDLRKLIEKHDAQVVYVISEITSGKDTSWIRPHAAEAKAVGAEILLAIDLSRLVRHQDFDLRNNSHLRPTERQLRRLKTDSLGLRRMTAFYPDRTWAYVQQNYYRRQGGAKPKKRRKRFALDKLTRARRLGLRGVREIARHYEVTPSTIQRAIERWEKAFERPWKD